MILVGVANIRLIAAQPRMYQANTWCKRDVYITELKKTTFGCGRAVKKL